MIDILQPELVIDPAGFVTKLRGYVGGITQWDRYRPSRQKVRSNIGIALGCCAYLVFGFITLDATRMFALVVALFIGLDILRWLFRVGRLGIRRLPVLPILYFPFTTIWIFAIALPLGAFYVDARLWWTYMALASGVSISLVAGRIDKHAQDYFLLGNEKLDAEASKRFLKACKNKKAFMLANGHYKIKATNEHLPGFEPGTFDRITNRWLKFRLWRRFFVFLLICGGFLAGSFELQNRGLLDEQENWVRYFWPSFAAGLVALPVLGALLRPSIRHRIWLTGWAIQLFANSPPPNEKRHLASGAAVSRYGHGQDRQAYLFWSFAIFTCFLLPLVVCGPVFIESPIVSEIEDYPFFGSMAWSEFRLPQPGWPFESSHFLPVALAHFIVPPVVFFFSLVLLIGKRLDDGYRLFEAEDALEHKRVLFDLNDMNRQPGPKVAVP